MAVGLESELNQPRNGHFLPEHVLTPLNGVPERMFLWLRQATRFAGDYPPWLFDCGISKALTHSSTCGQTSDTRTRNHHSKVVWQLGEEPHQRRWTQPSGLLTPRNRSSTQPDWRCIFQPLGELVEHLGFPQYSRHRSMLCAACENVRLIQ